MIAWQQSPLCPPPPFPPPLTLMLHKQANNILVGWSPSSGSVAPKGSTLGASHAAHAAQPAWTRRTDTLGGILGELALQRDAAAGGGVAGGGVGERSGAKSVADSAASSSSAPAVSSQRGGVIPHRALTTAIDLSLSLPKSQPVALLAGFYRGQHFRQVSGGIKRHK